MNRNEENVWEDVRKAKSTTGFDNKKETRQKAYDEYSPQKKDESIKSGGTFDFGTYDKPVVVKKAEYINKQQVNDLLDFDSNIKPAT